MKLLLVNDDGIESEGIIALANRLSRQHTVTVVAPLHNQSATSHSATFTVISYQDRGVVNGIHYYAVDGTPSDCTRFGIGYLNLKPDLVISGINNGLNVGYDILLSGTVAAAMEANFFSIPSIALSVYYKRFEATEPISYQETIDYLESNLERFYELLQGTKTTLNINVPMGEFKGEKICPHANSVYESTYKQVGNVLDTKMFQKTTGDHLKGTDVGYGEEGFVVLTPLKLNLSDEELISKWNQ